MICSMTGYGQARLRSQERQIEAEVQSVNGKFSSVTVSVPRNLHFLEYRIKELAKKYQARGSMHIVVTWEEGGGGCTWDQSRFDEYYRFLKRMKRRYGIRGDITLDHILRLSVNDSARRKTPPGAYWQAVREVTIRALEAWQRSRLKEGARVKRYFEKELVGLQRVITTISQHDARRLDHKKEAIKQKIQQLAAGVAKGRLESEMVVEVQKVDISEELQRLTSHVNLFKATLTLKPGQGRKLGFILQEMQREANTLAAKSGTIQFVRWAMNLKEGIERLREQIQNIE